MAVSPAFRWTVFVFLVLAGAGIHKLIEQSNEDDLRYRQREATARTLIRPSQLVLNEVKLGQSYGLWQVNGTVQNNSQYPLSRFWLHVTVQDCPAPSCVTIGEDDVGIDVKVPPRPIALAAQRMRWAYRIEKSSASNYRRKALRPRETLTANLSLTSMDASQKPMLTRRMC